MVKKIALIVAIAIVAISAQVGMASAALVNGGFESGDFTGWTLTNIDPDIDFVYVLNSGSQHSGDYEALLGKSLSTGTISQSFATTPGQAYKVSFWLANDGTPQMAGFPGMG